MDTIRAAARQAKLRGSYNAAHTRAVEAYFAYNVLLRRESREWWHAESRQTAEARKRYEHMMHRRASAKRKLDNWTERMIDELIKLLGAHPDTTTEWYQSRIKLESDGTVSVYYGGRGEPVGDGHGHLVIPPTGPARNRAPRPKRTTREVVALAS